MMRRTEDGVLIYSSALLDHDDDYHEDSAKRDAADGVAGLGPLGELLAPGSDLELTRDGSDNIELIERTSGEIVARWTRIGVNDYEFRLHCGAAACIILNDSMKNAANGVAGLDATSLLNDAQIPNNIARIAGGSYTGNGTVNRAIPHGLGVVPSLILLWEGSIILNFKIHDDIIACITGAGGDLHRHAVTSVDTTNFYVGNASSYGQSANGTGNALYWVAFV